jgi:putative ABC transport system substrate-binding protein
VGLDPFFNSRRTQLVQLAARHTLPASYPVREFAEVGGLMSYGANIVDAWRRAASTLVQSSKFVFVINAQITRMLGLTVPRALLATADELID